MPPAECWGTDTQVSNGMTQEWLPWVPDWRHPWIITYGPKLKFLSKCVFIYLFIYLLYYIILIIQSCLSPPLWRWTSGHPVSPVVCQHHQTTLVFFYLKLSLPSIVSCHLRGQSGSCTLGHLGGREEASVLRECSEPFDGKDDWQWVFAQLADMAPRGGWVERARMANDEPEWGQRTRSSKLCHRWNYKGAKGFLRW